MKTLLANRKYLVLILAAILMGFGIQGSYGQTITASVQQPLTEANLHGSVVALTLSGGTYERSEFTIERAVTISGIDGVAIADFFGLDRASDTEVTIELEYAGNIDADGTLTFTVGAGAIAGYSGNALTATVPVTALEESLDASTASPLTEANLHGSVVTLTLSGRNYEQSSWDIERSLTVSGIDGVTVASFFGVDRVSDTEVTVELAFDSDFDTDGTLTFTVGAGAIAGYNEGFTAQVSVTALEESLAASTEFPLTEANLHESVVTLTLSGRNYEQWIPSEAVTVSGIDGVTFDSWDVDRVSDTQVTVELTFDGDFDTDATLTFTVGADAVAGYSEDFTVQVSVTALEESLVASTEFPLTEATLPKSVVTLTLSGRRFSDEWDIERALTVSGIDGVTVSSYPGVERVSDTEVTIELAFNGDFDTDATLTLTIDADAIVGYNKDFTAQVSVTAIEQSNATVSVSPASVQSPDVGEEITFSLNIANGTNVAGYQATVLFDRTAFRLVNFTEGNYLPADAFFADPTVIYGGLGGSASSSQVTLTANTLAEASNGAGTLVTLTFKVVDFKSSTLTLSQVYLVNSAGKRWEATTANGVVTIPPEPAEEIVGDINRDGVVDILDLTIVGARLGQRGQNSADLNGDGLVDIVDLVLVASEFGDEAAAPSLYPQALELLTTADVRQWLSRAQQLTLRDPAYLRGITVLEQLHAALIPQETVLLRNYPNPFNPETWIPYRLSHASDVDITIYDTRGMVVRRLDLGHQMAGYYTDRTKAAYWNGRNEHGESVASGIYFYQLRARDYTALRRMVILK